MNCINSPNTLVALYISNSAFSHQKMLNKSVGNDTKKAHLPSGLVCDPLTLPKQALKLNVHWPSGYVRGCVFLAAPNYRITYQRFVFSGFLGNFTQLLIGSIYLHRGKFQFLYWMCNCLKCNQHVEEEYHEKTIIWRTMAEKACKGPAVFILEKHVCLFYPCVPLFLDWCLLPMCPLAGWVRG